MALTAVVRPNLRGRCVLAHTWLVRELAADQFGIRFAHAERFPVCRIGLFEHALPDKKIEQSIRKINQVTNAKFSDRNRLYSGNREGQAQELHPEDSLAETNINNGNFEKLKQDAIPELLLVKKSYDKSQRKQSRNWKLKHFTKEGALDTNIEADYNEFLKEDPEMRQNVNIFKDAARQQSMPVDPSVPRITLEELLDYLVLDDGEMCDA
ncbi:hypothetical protein quinque_010310 [Culex quinquefasciatus]